MKEGHDQYLSKPRFLLLKHCFIGKIAEYASELHTFEDNHYMRQKKII